MDFGAHYNHDFGAVGTLGLGVDGTYYLQYKVQTFTYTKFYDVIGYYGSLASDVEHISPHAAGVVFGRRLHGLGHRKLHPLGARCPRDFD